MHVAQQEVPAPVPGDFDPAARREDHARRVIHLDFPRDAVARFVGGTQQDPVAFVGVAKGPPMRRVEIGHHPGQAEFGVGLETAALLQVVHGAQDRARQFEIAVHVVVGGVRDGMGGDLVPGQFDAPAGGEVVFNQELPGKIVLLGLELGDGAEKPGVGFVVQQQKGRQARAQGQPAGQRLVPRGSATGRDRSSPGRCQPGLRRHAQVRRQARRNCQQRDCCFHFSVPNSRVKSIRRRRRLVNGGSISDGHACCPSANPVHILPCRLNARKSPLRPGRGPPDRDGV